MIEWMNEWIKILSVLQDSEEEEKGDEDREQEPPPIMKDNNPSNIQKSPWKIMFYPPFIQLEALATDK